MERSFNPAFVTSLDSLIEIYIPPKHSRVLNYGDIEKKIRSLFPSEDIEISVS